MLLKYFKQDIVDAIAEVLFEANEGRLNYTELYYKVNSKLLHQIESDEEGKLSDRDFTAQLKIMVNENRLIREEEQYDPNKRRMPKVYYSLTANAKKERLFGTLGNDPVKERRRKLYHLLFFFMAFSPIRHISSGEAAR